jgi:predicted DCC family thiol-disulfide oxidoreductase YuxK
MTSNTLFPEKPLVLFDGVCNLCNSSVQFIIEHDPEGKIMFCSLQSERGQAILKYLGRETDRFDTFIFIENGEAFTGSTGVLKEIRYLSGGWRYLSIFRFIPRPIRDFFYNIVAQNRYRLFGKKNECWMPTPGLKARFF